MTRDLRMRAYRPHGPFRSGKPARRGFILSIVCVALLAPSTEGRNLLKGSNDTIILTTPDYVMWGIELDGRPGLPNDPNRLDALVRPWVIRGVNSVGFSLQDLDPEGLFFTRDGKSCDRKAAEQFARFMSDCAYQRLGAVVSLFRADRNHWLASADAYRNAAQTISTLLPQFHSSVFVVGDLFGTIPWEPESPYPMNDPGKLLELCRAIVEANPEAIVAIPSSVLERSDSKTAGAPLFYAAGTAKALEQFVAERRDGRPPGGKPGMAAAVDGRHFLCRREMKGDADGALRRYAEQVERERLAIHAPGQGSRPAAIDEILTAEEKSSSWVPLFDGRTLDGWSTLVPGWGRWSVENGAIQCAPGEWPWPCLFTRQRYDSFILRLEYRLEKGGNSGVYLWSPLDGRPSCLGIEVQLSHTQQGTLGNRETTGAIYGVLAPREDAARPPGEWNRVEIVCRGSNVTVTINDRVVQDFDADKIPALQNRLRAGLIGLQNHGSLVCFRRSRIKPLNGE
jgi:hypothetical protein